MKILLANLLAPVILFTMPTANVGSIIVYGVTEQVHAEHMNFVGSYPQFTGMQDGESQIRWNSHMCEMKKAAFVRAKTAVVALPTDDRSEHAVDAVFGYEVKRNIGGLVSILFRDYLFSGGANGKEVNTGLTVSTVTGLEWKLADLFQNQASYRTIINDEISKQLLERGLESQLLAKFTGIQEDECFYITKTSLVIVVNETDWFPHDMGTVEFVIPFTQLQSCLKDGVI